MLSRAPSRVVRDWICDSRQWDGYKPRAGDVVIATPPKVGTTWTQQIVNLLVFQSPEPRPLGPLSPWIDCRFQIPIEVALPMIEAQTHRRFLKSHLPMDALPIYDEVRYIHVARDGRDACMSFLNHFNSFTPAAFGHLDEVGLADETIGRPVPRPPKTPREFFHHWIADGDGNGAPMTSRTFFDIERSFWAERARPNLLIVHYNDLKADLSGEMKRIAAFLDIETPDELWPQLVEAATFDAMKRDGGILLAGMEVAFRNGHETFLHSGTNNRWKGELTPDDLELYRAKVAAETTPGLSAWLEGGRAAAGDPRSAAA
ncbi:MAG TPA: sulfotransferase domain-containing protein [Phenylobacterium sp.]|nr:sulfotransferase domain-containing protein [Phenylobacterium sp.]